MSLPAASIYSHPVICLPPPHSGRYELEIISSPDSGIKAYKFRGSPSADPGLLPLQAGEFRFTQLSLENGPSVTDGNNSPWVRAKRSPFTVIEWDGSSASFTQVWMAVYALLTMCPEYEIFRLKLSGSNAMDTAQQLQAAGLATEHPPPSAPPGQPVPVSHDHQGTLVVSRSAFWQGAGSPFGPKPVWLTSDLILNAARPTGYTISTKFPSARVHARHPVRPRKPAPGSTIYSRYIPHLKETFSMVALDWQNDAHVGYFNTWQNEPRVAESWNETGTLDEHREYLRKIHEDEHQFAVLGKFDDTFFAYFEIYWAKEDHVGAYYDASDYDRGRHLLVGDARFRGPHRVKAWHSSLTHYMFLDEPRTNLIVAEPRATGKKILKYDQENGYYIDKWIDLPHKRAALIKCTRERFFQLCPFEYNNPTYLAHL